MKITAEHYEALSTLVSNHYTKQTAEQYKDAGLSYRRFLHDALFNTSASKWICDNLYPYMNDDKSLQPTAASRSLAKKRTLRPSRVKSTATSRAFCT